MTRRSCLRIELTQAMERDFALVRTTQTVLVLIIYCYFRIAPLFSKVNAALTTPESGHEIRQMFETLLKDIMTTKRKGGRTSDGRDIVIPKGHFTGEQ